jgi:hypothetical protein
MKCLGCVLVDWFDIFGVRAQSPPPCRYSLADFLTTSQYRSGCVAAKVPFMSGWGQSRRLDCQLFTSGIRLTPAYRCAVMTHARGQSKSRLQWIWNAELVADRDHVHRIDGARLEGRLELNDVFGRNALHAAIADESRTRQCPCRVAVSQFRRP